MNRTAIAALMTGLALPTLSFAEGAICPSAMAEPGAPTTYMAWTECYSPDPSPPKGGEFGPMVMGVAWVNGYAYLKGVVEIQGQVAICALPVGPLPCETVSFP